MRLAFLGTPDHAANVLRALVDAGHEVGLVVTQPDRRRGRGGTTSASAVKHAAEQMGLAVTHRVDDLLDVDVDLGVLVAFGRIIKPHVLRHVTILNIHPSLLPRWRGATPAEAAILAGDRATGVCVMGLSDEMDAGPVYASAETLIRDDESARQLYARLFAIGTELLLEQLQYGLSEPVPQVGEPTYCGKLTPEDFHIDWSEGAERIGRLVRVGRAWTTWRGRRLVVVEARGVTVDDMPLLPGELSGSRIGTGDGALELVTVQPEGKQVMTASDWARGARPRSGERLE